jgi:hypothetical protein
MVAFLHLLSEFFLLFWNIAEDWVIHDYRPFRYHSRGSSVNGWNFSGGSPDW